jgi:hypothetical protein
LNEFSPFMSVWWIKQSIGLTKLQHLVTEHIVNLNQWTFEWYQCELIDDVLPKWTKCASSVPIRIDRSYKSMVQSVVKTTHRLTILTRESRNVPIVLMAFANSGIGQGDQIRSTAAASSETKWITELKVFTKNVASSAGALMSGDW